MYRWFLAGYSDKTYYKTVEDAETLTAWIPPPVVGKVLLAKQTFTQPWTLCNVPFSLYWQHTISLITAAQSRAEADVHRRNAKS